MICLQPHKPVVDGEPAYEDLALKFCEFATQEGVLDDKGLIQDRDHFTEGFLQIMMYAYIRIGISFPEYVAILMEIVPFGKCIKPVEILPFPACTIGASLLTGPALLT